MLPWRSPLVQLPQPGTQVWIRRLPWYDRPVKAMWNNDYNTFDIETLMGNTQAPVPRSLDWPTIHTWKYQFLADEQAQFPPT